MMSDSTYGGSNRVTRLQKYFLRLGRGVVLMCDVAKGKARINPLIAKNNSTPLLKFVETACTKKLVTLCPSGTTAPPFKK